MTSVTCYKAIVVTVETYGNNGDMTWDSELAPDLNASGADMDRKLKGNEFAAFVADTLVPYIQQYYNVDTEAHHTAIADASLKGLESF